MRCPLQDRLHQRGLQGNLRKLVNRLRSVDFASNDYLGLARSQTLRQRIFNELNQHEGCINGSTGSRLLTGNTRYAEELESAIAHFHGYEAALIYTCGYMANMGLITALAGPDDVIFYDIAVHASAHDGMKMSAARAVPFKHNDAEHLEKRLQSYSCLGHRYILIESIYSTDGSVAPLKRIAELAKQYQALLIVDEAHAAGIYGNNGEGLVHQLSLTQKVFAVAVTFGKALGAHGAAILGSNTLKEFLINFSRPQIYTTALPLHSLAAIKASYDLLPLLSKERQHVHELVKLIPKANSHISSLIIKGSKKTREASNFLLSHGYDVMALLPPTVKRGNECLRMCLHAFNTKEEIRHLLSLIYHYQECICAE